MRIAVWLLCVLALSGCSTTTLEPPKYYVLSVAPSTLIDREEDSIQVTLDNIKLAGYLQSSNMVLQVSDHELFFSSNHLWAESLKVGIEKTLAQHVSLTSTGETSPIYLDIVIDYFHTIDQDSVILAGSFALREASKPVKRQSFSLSEPLSRSGYHYSVSVMSDLVDQLGRDISQQVEEYKSSDISATDI
ncbi:PqiC family protein [Marinomonas atlantica]|uniref:PqiC family protein n=1 Tax=Marinomonas atlantica TaxID=1806668 RepID=UPI000837354F|nr:PqiC family protein [Marinomonas atlantica]